MDPMNVGDDQTQRVEKLRLMGRGPGMGLDAGRGENGGCSSLRSVGSWSSGGRAPGSRCRSRAERGLAWRRADVPSLCSALGARPSGAPGASGRQCPWAAGRTGRARVDLSSSAPLPGAAPPPSVGTGPAAQGGSERPVAAGPAGALGMALTLTLTLSNSSAPLVPDPQDVHAPKTMPQLSPQHVPERSQHGCPALAPRWLQG